jgi:hypothetical protein
VFRHGVVLSVIPSNLVRTIVAFTIATGAAATCLGLVVFAAAADRPIEAGDEVPGGPTDGVNT